MRFFARIAITALAVAVAAWLLPGIRLDAESTGQKVLVLVAVAIIFGLVNVFVKPLFTVLTGCLVLLTFGLFLFVINGLMLLLTSWISGQLGLGFHVDGFWSAVFGSIVISLVSALGTTLLGPDRGRS